MLTKREVERRKPVWRVFSEFFLDTSLTATDIDRIARVAVESGFSFAQLRDIYLCEVAPAVGFNLWSIAGEWAGFDEAWLYERATARANHRSPFVRLFAFVHGRLWFLTYLGDIAWHRTARRIRALHKEQSSSKVA